MIIGSIRRYTLQFILISDFKDTFPDLLTATLCFFIKYLLPALFAFVNLFYISSSPFYIIGFVLLSYILDFLGMQAIIHRIIYLEV